MLIGAVVGTAMGTLLGAMTISQTHDMTSNPVGTFSAMVGLSLMAGVLRGGFGAFMRSEFTPETRLRDLFFDNELVFYRGRPIHVPIDFFIRPGDIVIIH